MAYEKVLSDEETGKLRDVIDGFRVLNPALPLEQQLLWLDEDLFHGTMPDGSILDIGWYPSQDPDGCFRVDVNEDGEVEWNPVCEGECRAIGELRQIVRRVIHAHSTSTP